MALSVLPWPTKQTPGASIFHTQRNVNGMFKQFNYGFELAPFEGSAVSEWRPTADIAKMEKEIQERLGLLQAAWHGADRFEIFQNLQEKPDMKVSDVMHSYVEHCQPSDNIVDIAMKMLNHDCGIIPIVVDGKPVGVITDRDITTRVVATAQYPREVCVRDVMSTSLICINENATLNECCGLMGQHRVRRLLVTHNDGSLAGIVSMADVAKHSDPRETGHLIKLISESEQAIVQA